MKLFKSKVFWITSVICVPFWFYLLDLNYLEPTQVGIARNFITGTLSLQDRPGWHFTLPCVMVARIDTRPQRVCVTTTAHGSFAVKLVQFNPQYYKEFVQTQGFYYYWWANRFSINFGYNEEYRGMKDILRGYAFSSVKYPFITVLNDSSWQQYHNQ